MIRGSGFVKREEEEGSAPGREVWILKSAIRNLQSAICNLHERGQRHAKTENITTEDRSQPAECLQIDRAEVAAGQSAVQPQRGQARTAGDLGPVTVECKSCGHKKMFAGMGEKRSQEPSFAPQHRGDAVDCS